jgi:hypothetical protein
MSEHALQNEIRNELAGKCLCFRANVGEGWASNDISRLPDGSLILRNPRRFSTGLPPGFHDLFGVVDVEITPDMVGRSFPMFWSVDVKAAKGVQRTAQKNFMNAIVSRGGRSGFAKTVAQAVRIVLGLNDESAGDRSV